MRRFRTGLSDGVGIVTTTITETDTLVLSLTSPTGSFQTVGEGSAPSYTLAIANGNIPVGSTATVDLAITLPGGLTGAEASDFVETSWRISRTRPGSA